MSRRGLVTIKVSGNMRRELRLYQVLTLVVEVKVRAYLLRGYWWGKPEPKPVGIVGMSVIETARRALEGLK